MGWEIQEEQTEPRKPGVTNRGSGVGLARCLWTTVPSSPSQHDQASGLMGIVVHEHWEHPQVGDH